MAYSRTTTELQKVLAAHFDTTVAAFTPSGLTDVSIIAINNAKRLAETIHDFELSRVRGRLVVGFSSGVPFSDITPYDGSLAVDVKKIEGAYYNGRPIHFTSRKEIRQRTDRIIASEGFNDSESSQSYYVDSEHLTLYQQGGMLYLWPDMSDTYGSTVTIDLDVVKWWPDLTIGTDTTPGSTNVHFLLEYGFNWMMWKSIVELNSVYKEFVYKQEGTIPPPDKYVTEAWNALMSWDAYLTESGNTYPMTYG